MKTLNSYQEMVRSMKTFIATASDQQLNEKKEILISLIASDDHELAKAAGKCLHLIQNEIKDRDE
jgi:hypothetical protein